MKQVFADFLPARYPGPVSTVRQIRAKVSYLILVSLGFALAMVGGTHGLQAFGLGLIFPGAGFLQYLNGGWLSGLAHLALFLLTMGLFVASLLFAWFWNGNILAPIAVWFLSALGAGMMDHQHSFKAAPLLVLALVMSLILFLQANSRKDARRRSETLKRRRTVIGDVRLPTSPLDAETRLREVKELSLEDLQLLRYAYDRALQPVDEWNGFTKSFNSEWQGSGTRYQTIYLGYALSLTNYTALPAMRSYLQQAQLNLLEKTRQPFVWSYWRWERLWGTLTWNPDPFSRHNLMYSGYLAKSIGFYQNATGDLRHNEEGAYTLTDTNGEEYRYNFPKICSVLSGQYLESELGWISCEPNFQFSICNAIGMTGVATRLARKSESEKNDWPALQSLYQRKQIDEYTFVDGTVMPGKLSHLGVPIVPPGFADTYVTLMQAAYNSAVLPYYAATQYEIAKSEILKCTDKGLQLADVDSILAPDPATMKKGYAWSLSMLLIAAREYGDTETAEFAERLIEQYCPTTLSDGIRHSPGQSVMAHAKMIMGRVATTNCQHDLVNLGSDERWLNGPLLTDAAYPKVQVAKAVSDGVNLELVLYPENEPNTQEIEISQMKPGAEYRQLVGDSDFSFFADEQGKARISVALNGRTSLNILRV